MNRVLLALFVLCAGLAAPARAAAPDAARADAWCGAFLNIVVGSLPANPSPQEMQLASIFLDAGDTLLSRARQAHGAAGFSPSQTNAFIDDMNALVIGQIAGGAMEFSYEDCIERAGL
jgi:hypothetical protein